MVIASAVVLADTWGMHGDIGTGWWIVMMFGMVLFWAAVIVGILWFVRGSARGSTTWQPERVQTPLEILDRRFAAGEISADEYDERRQVLAGSAAPTGPREPVGT
jgi:putative membrane protein